MFEETSEFRKAGQVALALGELHKWRAELDDAEQCLQLAVALLREPDEERQRAVALLGNLLIERGDGTEAMQYLDEASLNSTGEYLNPATAFWLSRAFVLIGDNDKASRTTMAGLRRSQDEGSRGASGLLAYGAVFMVLRHVQLSGARSFAGIVERGVSEGAPESKHRSLECQAGILIYTGEWEKVRKLSETWKAEARLLGRFKVSVAQFMLAVSLLTLGQPLAAKREILPALPHLAALGPLARMYLTKTLLETGSADEATSMLAKNAKQILEGPNRLGEIALLGDMVAQFEMPTLWQAGYDEISKIDRPMTTPVFNSVQRILGRLAARLDLWKQSIDHFETALEQLSDAGAPWELAQTYLCYAEMRFARRRRGDVTKAMAFRHRAADILESIGLELHEPPSNRPDQAERNAFALTTREIEVLA